MDDSKDRRERTERLFGDLWDLRRSPAVAGSHGGALLALLGKGAYEKKQLHPAREV